MPNIFDYLTWRGDVPLALSPFNPVDNLILSELSYTDFGGIVPDDGTEIPLEEACLRFFETHDREEIRARTSFTAKAPFLMEAMLAGARFRDLRLCSYETLYDREDAAQFAAVTCLVPDGTAFISFRGTDGTIIGWKEDFTLGYRSGTRGQTEAAVYLDRAASRTDRPLLVGGHSKGGNFAIYAASVCSSRTRSRIRSVWSNDGPGFRREVRDLPGYREILDRTRSIVPDTSVIGLLLANDCPRQVVKSTASGIVQHDGFSWETGPYDFVPAELSRGGEYMEKTLRTWIEKQGDDSLRTMVESVFRVLEAPGEDHFHSLTSRKLKTAEIMMLALRSLPKERQKELLQATGQLFQSTGTAAKSLLEGGREPEPDPEEAPQA